MKLASITIVLLLSSHGGQGSTIPCPGFDDPSTFLTIPLSDRPNLSKVLQHGYQPKLLTATLPSQEGPNIVQTHEGFVSRPFRRITPDDCPFDDGSVSGFRCWRASSARVGPAVGSRAEAQVLLELAQRHRGSLPVVDSYLSPSFSTVWADEVRKFMVENNVECQEDTASLVALSEYSCTVGGCFEIEPDFVDDLFVLNDQLLDEDLDAFQSFINKWGHGSVETVSFGAIEYKVFAPEDDTGNRPTLYMGQAGGSRDRTDGEGNYYTEEECLDPAPIFLAYTPWEDILEQLFPIWYYDTINTTALNLDAIGDKFRELRRTYTFLFQEIDEAGISLVNCPRLDPGALSSAPSNAPSVASSSGATTTAPTLRSTIAPTETNTESGASASLITSMKTASLGVSVVTMVMGMGLII